MFKRFLRFVLIALLAVFVLAACAPAQSVAQRVVELPEKIQLLITAACVFVVGWVFAQIGARLPWFVQLFGKYADEIAFALSGTLITLIQGWLNMIPPGWEDVGNIALTLLVAVLAALQVFRFLGKVGVKSFRA